jgi:phenylacetate-CoA ligase
MFHKQLFIFAHQLGDRSFYPSYLHLLKNQWRSYAELKEDQEKQLRHLISFAYDNVPYYNRLFHQLKLKPSDVRFIADLEKLPILTKNIIKQNWEDLKPVGLNKMKYYEDMTSGSTGMPVYYRLSRKDRFFSGAILYRGWGYGGYELGDRMVFLAGASLNVGTKTTANKKIQEFVRNTRMLSTFGMSEQDMREYVDVINSFKPRFIRGYASSIFFFAKWLEESNLYIHSPEFIFTTTEKLLPYMREKISETFHCEVLDGYGLNDGGIGAYECPEHRGFHIDTERGLMEIVDEKGIQIQQGEGKILATSLGNYAMPFIRYDTGDVGNLVPEDDVCACGRGYRLLKEIIGRSADFLVAPDGRYVQGWYLAMLIAHKDIWENQVKEFQVVQKVPHKIIINVVPEPNFDERLLSRIQQYVNERELGWDLELRIVNEIERTRTGKYRFIINEIPK